MALELRGYANFYQHEFGVRTPSYELEMSFRSSWAGAGIFMGRDLQSQKCICSFQKAKSLSYNNVTLFGKTGLNEICVEKHFNAF